MSLFKSFLSRGSVLRGMTAAALVASMMVLPGCSHTKDAAAGAPLPNNFDVSEHLISFTTKLDVVAGGLRYGTITEKMLSFTTSMVYNDAVGNRIVDANMKFFSIANEVDIHDASGKLAYRVHEDILASLFHPMSNYYVMDAYGHKIAQSEKVELFATTFTLRDMQGNEIARIHRSAFSWPTDVWSVEVLRPDALPSYVYVVIASFKTAQDNKKKAEEEAKKHH